MNASENAVTPDRASQPREAVLRAKSGGIHWSANILILKLLGALGALAAFGLFTVIDDAAGILVALPAALIFLAAQYWWIFRTIPKRLQRQQRDAVLTDLKQKLTAVRFRDGSISDFSPTGGFLLVSGHGMAFDAIRLLVRYVQRPGSVLRSDFDWIWGLDDCTRVEVRRVPIKGWKERLRQATGFQPRTRLAFSMFWRHLPDAADWPIAEEYAVTGTKLAAVLNRHLTDRDAASSVR